MAETRAQSNKRVRQDALREQLEGQGHVQHVVEIIEKLSEPSTKIDAGMVARYKLVIDTKLKLINKYLPDVKQVEITGEDGSAIEIDQKWEVEFVNAEAVS